jgi:type IV pilus assembly protein PilP
VREGNYMGRNYGKIIHIQEDQIELLENVPDGPNVYREHKATLILAEAGGEKK